MFKFHCKQHYRNLAGVQHDVNTLRKRRRRSAAAAHSSMRLLGGGWPGHASLCVARLATHFAGRAKIQRL